MRRISNLLLFVLGLYLSACSPPGLLQGDVSATQGAGQVVRVGILVLCETPEVMALRQAHWPRYAVAFWHREPQLQPCSVKVDVSLIPRYGEPSVWAARNVSPRSEHLIPRNLITRESRLCIRTYGAEPVNDPMMEHMLINGTEHRYSTCDKDGEFYASVIAGRTSNAPGKTWRQVAIVRRKP